MEIDLDKTEEDRTVQRLGTTSINLFSQEKLNSKFSLAYGLNHVENLPRGQSIPSSGNNTNTDANSNKKHDDMQHFDISRILDEECLARTTEKSDDLNECDVDLGLNRFYHEKGITENIDLTNKEIDCVASSPGKNIAKDGLNLESDSPKRLFEIFWLRFSYSIIPNIFQNSKFGIINKLLHKKEKTIISSISGRIICGEMVALMGPSGAGKTCLLESIAGVRSKGVGGSMWIRGRSKAQMVIVPQYDDFMRQFTVEETIVFSSKMKNHHRSDHIKIADETLNQLSLDICRKNNIQRCSGGQRKRVAIAQELVSKPNVLILDEPTSGLDSSCCYQTMKVLRDVVSNSLNSNEPMAILMTIHQPSAKVFKMFDRVYLLSKSGNIAYSGSPSDLLPTIERLTSLKCPKYTNPSDYMIELVACDYGDHPVKSLEKFEKEKSKDFESYYDEVVKSRKNIPLSKKSTPSKYMWPISKFFREDNSCVKDTMKLTSQKSESGWYNLATDNYLRKFSPEELRRATNSRNLSHPLIRQCWCHLSRSFLQSIRDPILNNMRILIHVWFAALLVLMYGKMSGEARGCPPIIGLPKEITDPRNESLIDLSDNVGYLFMCIMMVTYVSLMSTVLTFPLDIKTVGKEYKNGWYGVLSYLIGKTIADLPFIIIYPVLYSVIVWYMTNQAQDDFWRFVCFTTLIVLNAMNSQSFGLILGALFMNSVAAATFLGPVLTIPWYLFTGFTKRVKRLDEPYKSLSPFLFTRQVFEGLLVSVYGYGRCNCTEFLDKYKKLRLHQALNLGEILSTETLSALDYYDSSDFQHASTSDEIKHTYIISRSVSETSSLFGVDKLNLSQLIEGTNEKASSVFSFGLDFEPECPDSYDSFIIEDFDLNNDTLLHALLATFAILVLVRALTFGIVAWKIKTRTF